MNDGPRRRFASIMEHPSLARRYGSALFDLDGTLVDSACMVTKALDRLCDERGAPAVQLQAVRGWISLGAETLVASALRSFATSPARDLARFREILTTTPTDAQDVYPDVATTLGKLCDAGIRLAIVTNKPQALSERLLSDLGLARWFGAIVGGDSTPYRKPHPAPLRAALAAIDGRAASTCLVGDSIVDARAAAAMAIPFYLYDHGYGAAKCPDRLIQARFARFDLLPALLGRQAS